MVVFFLFRSDAPARVRVVSCCLRLAALALLALPLFEPALVTPSVIPNENFVVVLVDDSGSMSVTDGPSGQTRLDQAHELLYGEEGGHHPRD